jgi:hypothetical protein
VNLQLTPHLDLNSSVTLLVWNWTLTRVALCNLRADHAQKSQLYCWLAPTAEKTSHVVPIVASGISRRGQVTWLPLRDFIGALAVA